MPVRGPSTPATRSSSRTKPTTSASAPPVPTTATGSSSTTGRATRAATRTASVSVTRARTTRAGAVPAASTATTPGAGASTTTAATRRLKSVAERNPASVASRVASFDNKGKNKENPSGSEKDKTPPSPSKKDLKHVTTNAEAVKDEDREPIKAFLRIRPDLSESSSTTTSPYLTCLSSTEVQMTPPSTSISITSPAASSMSRLRLPTTTPLRATYTFTHVFPPETVQSEFFSHTAVPLIKDLLNGENGLLFAYGVTNSGKTHTIQGKNGPGEAGLLPRTLDVVFNSLEGLQADGGDGDVAEGDAAPNADESFFRSLLPESENVDPVDKDDTILTADKNYEYQVLVSYAEIYNEKVFDLLAPNDGAPSAGVTPSSSFNNLHANVNNNNNNSSSRSSVLPHSLSSHFNLSSLASSSSTSNLLKPGPTTLKRQALTLKTDPLTGSKVVANLREVHVRSAEEAKRVVKFGQVNRRVFGTIMNKESSRSHAVFTVRVGRVHKGRQDDPDGVQSARLSVVDLAGSERTRNTQSAGERLKEAGSINKSLMVLGQCMEVLRNNQKKLASAAGFTVNLKSIRLAHVPFRHSKLTELFQDFFIGEGRAVMIVNVNPYDTGYDENSHVMKFSALAREVSTVKPQPAALVAISRKPSLASIAESRASMVGGSGSGIIPPGRKSNTRQVKFSYPGAGGAKPVERVFDIVEEDEVNDVEEIEDDDERDTLVDRLFEELDLMRDKLFEAELRCALVESETREAVMREMEERMGMMEQMHARRLQNETEENEMKMDRKIDLLHQAGLLGGPSRSRMDEEGGDSEEEEEAGSDESGDVEDVDASIVLSQGSDRASTASPSPLPRAVKSAILGSEQLDGNNARGSSSAHVDSEPMDEDVHTDHAEDADQESFDDGAEDFDSEDDEEEEEEEGEDSASDDEWTPNTQEVQEVEEDEELDVLPKPRKSRPSGVPSPTKSIRSDPAKTVSVPDVLPEDAEDFDGAEPSESIPMDIDHSAHTEEIEHPKPKSKTIKQVREVHHVTADDSLDELAIVLNRKARQHAESSMGERSTYVPDVGEPGIVKKKKRKLAGPGAMMTEDDILQVARKVEQIQVSGSLGGSASKSVSGGVRRMERSSR